MLACCYLKQIDKSNLSVKYKIGQSKRYTLWNLFINILKLYSNCDFNKQYKFNTMLQKIKTEDKRLKQLLLKTELTDDDFAVQVRNESFLAKYEPLNNRFLRQCTKMKRV